MTCSIRLIAFLACCSLAASCSSTGTTGSLQPTQSIDTSTTAAIAPVRDWRWESASIPFGVTSITRWGSGFVGLAIQEFKAPDSLLDRDGIGCFDFRAGRTGEVVWSSDGIEWDSVAGQPSWYPGPLTAEEWVQIEASDADPPALPEFVALATNGDLLVAAATETDTLLAIEAWEPQTESWKRIGSIPMSPDPQTSAFDDLWPFAVASFDDEIVVVALATEGRLGAWSVRDGAIEEHLGAFRSLDWFDTENRWAQWLSGLEMVSTSRGLFAEVRSGFRVPRMLSSADGHMWTEVSYPGSVALDLTSSGEIVLASSWRGTWYRNAEGFSWSPVDIEELGWISSMTGGTYGFFAVGSGEQLESPQAVWFSADGERWEPVFEFSDDHQPWHSGMAVTDDAVVVTAREPRNEWPCPEIQPERYVVHVGSAG